VAVRVRQSPPLSGPPEEPIQSTEEESHSTKSCCPFALDSQLSCDRINRIVLVTASHAVASSFGKWLLATYADGTIVPGWRISSHWSSPACLQQHGGGESACCSVNFLFAASRGFLRHIGVTYPFLVLWRRFVCGYIRAASTVRLVATGEGVRSRKHSDDLVAAPVPTSNPNASKVALNVCARRVAGLAHKDEFAFRAVVNAAATRFEPQIWCTRLHGESCWAASPQAQRAARVAASIAGSGHSHGGGRRWRSSRIGGSSSLWHESCGLRLCLTAHPLRRVHGSMSRHECTFARCTEASHG